MEKFIEIKDVEFSYMNEYDDPPTKNTVLRGVSRSIYTTFASASAWFFRIPTTR